MKGVILHGGSGTRLRPLTHSGPKQLLPIANKPMSEYCIESLKEAGIIDIAIIIGGVGSAKVKDYYGSGENFGVKITYVEQDHPRGIAHAINLCKDFVKDENFVVYLGDNILNQSIAKYVNDFENSESKALILLCEVDNPSKFGVVDLKDGRIIQIMEKPKNPPTNFAVIGVYCLSPLIFDIFSRLKPSDRNEYEITDSLQMLLDEHYIVDFDYVTENWKDTGTPEDIILANKLLLDHMEPYFLGQKEEHTILEGNIMVGKNSIIKSGARIIGPVIIGDDCIINANSILGPNASIGNNTSVSNCQIQDSVIMENCNIDCDWKIKKSIIGSNSKIISNGKENSFDKILLLGEGTQIYF